MKCVSGLLAMLILALVCCAMEVVAAPYQELPPRLGHIPVYIRERDQPLSEIHPGLAEAFHELEDLVKKDGGLEKGSHVQDPPAGSKDEEDTSKLLNGVKLPETDIASFDAVKETDSEIKASTPREAEEHDLEKKNNDEEN